MHFIIRQIVSILTSVVVLLVSFFSTGEIPSFVEMPEFEAGEYGQWVKPFTGTGGVPFMSPNNFPGAASPYGAVKLSPDTSTIGDLKVVTGWGTAGYTYSHGYILGFSHTRLSGTAIPDMGHFRVTPANGSKKVAALNFSHNQEMATAGYYAVNLPAIGCIAELTSTTHVGAHRYTFRNSKDARIYLDVTSTMPGGSCLEGEVNYNPETGEISGYSVANTSFTARYGGLKAYFVAVCDTPVESYKILSEDKAVDGNAVQGTNLGVDLNFGNRKDEPVEMKLAISFVSVENARENLEVEAGDLDFDAIKQKAFDTWDSYLSRIKIEGTKEVKENFYTALYRSMLMPTSYTDVNGEYAQFGGGVGKAEGFTYISDMSLWDTFRTVAPVQALVSPDVHKNMLTSLVKIAEIYGSFPRWPSGVGETHSMYGSPATILFAESYLKGYDCFDAEQVYDFIKYEATHDFNGHQGRTHLNYYIEYGHCPADLTDEKCVSRTLEYAHADYCVATMANALGKTEDADLFLERSKNYLNIWDEDKQCFRAKNSDGSWFKPFTKNIISFIDDIFGSDFAYGFCEGGARHWQWAVQYDTEAMISLYGGNEKFTKLLNDFMGDANLMRNAVIPSSGYWHGNQHDLHAIYLFNDAGHPELTQKWARWAMDTRYATTPDGLDGNDDGGTISAWYVLSAMGIYPIVGTAEYWIGSPAVDSAELALANGKTLTIKANNQSDKNVYVKSIKLNGEEIPATRITHAQLLEGGELVFEMSKKPA